MYLNCHTYYSLRYGTLSPEQLVDTARRLGVNALALTDIHNVTAVPEFIQRCRQQGIRPVAGMEFRRGDHLAYIALARDAEGFRRINTFFSQHAMSGSPLPGHFPVCEHTFAVYPFAGCDPRDKRANPPAHTQLSSRANHGLYSSSRISRVFPPGSKFSVSQPTGSRSSVNRVHQDTAISSTEQKPFPHPHEYIGVRPGELHRLQQSAWAKHPERLVALCPVTLGHPDDHALHRHLRAIDHNIVLSKLQPQQMAHPDEVMLPPEMITRRYASHPHIIRNTQKLLEACSIDFHFNKLKNKKTFTGHPSDDKALLEKLARDGLEHRYGKDHQEARRRISNELEVIHKLGFSSYFLITWDIIRYSMSRGFYHVGRGSGANSIVAYCLQITDVDPIELDLYFERFINPKRSTPPDFDIDYSWKDRDQVLEYVFRRYGQAHTALLGTISTFHRRSAIRELGKVYGLPKSELDALADGSALRDMNKRAYSAGDDRVIDKVLHWAGHLIDFPNLRSIHAGGVLVSEEPICCYSALDMPPKGMPTVQWDMYTAEELGFEKIDILSQRGIGHINESVRLIKENRAKDVDVHRIDSIKKDEKIRTLLEKGDTTGCFYVESPAMRSLLKKLKCHDYKGLVAASSIIRPGVSRSGMMQEYIRRSHRPDQVKYLHPVMEEQLRETYGVMVYQEDVIKVCHHFAGLGLADADVLRRAMSGKYRSKKEMQRLVQRFFEGCRAQGHPESLTREVWRQIESFAGYSFSKAHSASFAVESYQSLYLKAHYPLEFITAVINNFGGFYRSEIYFHEARMAGARIELPCVNQSEYLNIIKTKTIFTGFVHIRQLEYNTCKSLLQERITHGPYKSLENLMRRTDISTEQLTILIRINALRFTGIPKAQLLWQIYLLAGKQKYNPPMLFEPPSKKYHFPAPENSGLTNAYDEIELLGFTLSISPFDLLQTRFRGDTHARHMAAYKGKSIRMVGWLVNTKYVRTVKQETMYFGCFLDHQGNFFDTVHFPQSIRSYPFRGSGIYLLKGVVNLEYNHPSLEVEKMARLPVKPDPREATHAKNLSNS